MGTIQEPSLPASIQSGPNQAYLTALRQALDRILRKVVVEVNGSKFEADHVFDGTGEPAYENGWEAGTVNVSGRFARNATGVMVMGEAKKTGGGNAVDGQVIATLPSGYVPRSTQVFPCQAVITAGAPASVSVRVRGMDAGSSDQGKIEWYGGTVTIPAGSVDQLSLATIQFAIDEV